MVLDDRKRRILQAIIDDYIDTAEPIGSRSIARKHELGLSSATIRNEMADLEDLGYLAQPHTSAGRIPSDKGYRLYVDQLMTACEPSFQEIDNIKKAMEISINELGQLLKQASWITSQVTKYPSVAITPQISKSRIRTSQLVPIGCGKLLIVVATDTDIVKNTLVRISETVLSDDIIKLLNIFNEKLGTLALEEIDSKIYAEIAINILKIDIGLLPVLDGIIDCISHMNNKEVYLEGTINILNFPEFRDIEKAKELLNLMDAKEQIYKLLEELQEHQNNKQINVQIGTENPIDIIKQCSLITTPVNIGDMIVGSIGVIGPTRMEYRKVISLINTIGEILNEEINKLFGNSFDNGISK